VNADQTLAAGGTSRTLVRIDPKEVLPSRWSTVDYDDLRGADFDRLKSSVEHTGGNVQPIKVRPTGTGAGHRADREPTGTQPYEIVFGYSRLQACQWLGLPVLAIVEDLSELQAAEQFAVEFWSDLRWRPWRMSRFVERVLDGGLYPSMRRAAGSFGMDLADILMLSQMATWPEPLRRALRHVELTRAHAKRIARFERETLVGFTDEGLPAKKRTAAMVLRRLEQIGGQA
jgi:ParB family chromosome partitioning protein